MIYMGREFRDLYYKQYFWYYLFYGLDYRLILCYFFVIVCLHYLYHVCYLTSSAVDSSTQICTINFCIIILYI